MTTERLVDKIIAIHQALVAADLPHAFGGALALAWCTRRARGTIDIDVNVFVGVERARDVVGALAEHVPASPADLQQLDADGQARLWWGRTPVDVFLDTTPFHREVGRRARTEPFGTEELPFLACRDLAVFKVFYDRTKDWADLEEMHAAGTLAVEHVLGVVVRYVGGDDARVARLRELADPVP